MSRIKLKDQWERLKNELIGIEQRYVESLFDGKFPAEVYSVTRKGEIEVWQVEKAMLSHSAPTCYWGKSPTKIDVVALREYLAKPKEWTPSDVDFNIEQTYNTCKVSRSVSLNELKTETWAFLDKTKAEAKATEIKETIQREKELLAAGGIRCRYCGSVRPPSMINYSSIISANYGPGMRSKPFPYCKDKQCSAYDQMAHEG